jgi:hypothetical protein
VRTDERVEPVLELVLARAPTERPSESLSVYGSGHRFADDRGAPPISRLIAIGAVQGALRPSTQPTIPHVPAIATPYRFDTGGTPVQWLHGCVLRRMGQPFRWAPEGLRTPRWHQ